MHHVACLGRGKGTKLQKKKLKTSIGNWLRYNRRRVSLDKEAYEKENANPLGGMLSTMLSGKMNYEEKSQRLSEDYGIQMNERMEKEMEFMCNYSDYILEEGRHEGRQEGLQEGRYSEVFSSVQEGDYGVERGAEKLNMSVPEFEKKMKEAGYKIPEYAD